MQPDLYPPLVAQKKVCYHRVDLNESLDLKNIKKNSEDI